MATDLDVERIECTISYKFRDSAILVEALTTPHKNEMEEGGVETMEGNRRLSALGEAVMRLFIAQEWYRGLRNNCKLCCQM
jgi:dsRNA-specific ribonuclease